MREARRRSCPYGRSIFCGRHQRTLRRVSRVSNCGLRHLRCCASVGCETYTGVRIHTIDVPSDNFVTRAFALMYVYAVQLAF